MKLLILILVFFAIPIIVAAEEKELYATVTDNVPEVRQETEVYLGDRMLSQRTGQWKECITPVDDIQRKAAMGQALIVHKGGEPICKKNAGSKKERYWPSSKKN